VNLYIGHINHSLFWKNLAPSASEHKGHGGSLHDGPLKKAIVERWGSLDTFTKEFNTTTAGIQGSGWGWLVRFFQHTHLANRWGSMLMRLTLFLFRQGVDPSSKKLEIVTTPNQDPLLSHVPVIGVDVWEHAFYLQYLNVKADVSSCNGLSFMLSLSDGLLVPQSHLAGRRFQGS
jgi:superoxide dismutase, Fe-Mn family